jgi:hypothetical protein
MLEFKISFFNLIWELRHKMRSLIWSQDAFQELNLIVFLIAISPPVFEHLRDLLLVSLESIIHLQAFFLDDVAGVIFWLVVNMLVFLRDRIELLFDEVDHLLAHI